MPDYGLDPEFGIFPTPGASRHHEVLEIARLADVLGLEHVSIRDHPYQAPHLDTWTLLSDWVAMRPLVDWCEQYVGATDKPRRR